MKKKKSAPASKSVKSKSTNKPIPITPVVSYVSEPVVAYGISQADTGKRIMPPRRNAPVSALKDFAVKAGDTHAVVIKAALGVPSSIFFELADKAGLQKEALAEKLNLSLKTMTRYRSNFTFLDRTTGEHLVRMVSLYEKGYEVFGSVPSFNSWMHKPAFGLGSQIPFNLLETPGGTDLVTEEVLRIEFGDLA